MINTKPVIPNNDTIKVKPKVKKKRASRTAWRDKYPDNWEHYYKLYTNKELSGTKIAKILDITQGTFYRLANRYSDSLSSNQPEQPEEVEYVLPSNETQCEVNNADVYKSFSLFRTKINLACKEIYTNPGTKYHTKNSVLNAAYSALLREYGICWEQYKKEFKRENERKPLSTLELVYWIESNNDNMKNLLYEKIHTIKKEQESEIVGIL